MAVTVEELRDRLGISGSDSAAMIQLSALLTDVESALKLLTGLRSLPSALDYLIYNVATDAYRLRNPGSSSVAAVVSSVKEGQKQVDFDTGTGGSGGYVAANAPISAILTKNYAAELKRIRRARW